MSTTRRRKFLRVIAFLVPGLGVGCLFAQQSEVDSKKQGREPAGNPFMGGSLTGNGFRTLSHPEKVAYAAGVWDGYLFSPALGAPSTVDQRLDGCLPRLVPDQLWAIIEKHMERHPEQWGNSMNFIVYSALPVGCRAGAD
jgi:hypothetical protein